jgi:polysaccharide biosynthesis transport protein
MQDSSSSEFDVSRYAAVLHRRKYTVLATALIVLSLFTWGSYLWPKTYQASCTVFIEKSSLINPLIQGIGVATSLEERLRNVRNGITSRNIIERVIKKLHLSEKAKSSESLEGMVAGIQQNLSVTVQSGGERETYLFIISYRGDDPMVVRNFVDALVKEYISESVHYQQTDALGVYEFIDSQLSEYKRKLEESDKNTREFRERNPQMIPQSENTIASRIEAFQTARIEGEIRLKELQRKQESLRKQLSGEQELTVAFVSREGSPESRLNLLNNQLILLMTKYTENYPEVVKVKSEIEELQKQIVQASTPSKDANSGLETKALNPVYRQIKEELQKTNTEIESLSARVDELIHQQNEGRTILGRMPKEQEEWSKLQRDRTVYQRVYDDLLQKLENARVSKNLELTDKGTTMRIVDPPLLPRVPIRPNRVLLIMLGFLCGIASGVAVAIGLDRIDQSFTDEGAVREQLNLPVLASVPSIITERDRLSAAYMQQRVFVATAVYLALIGLVFIGEFLHRYMGIDFI